MLTNECKICFTSDDKLIAPCKCKGTIKYVHSNCLEQWRNLNINNSRYYQCNECKYTYKLRYQSNCIKNILVNITIFIHYILSNKIMGTIINLYIINLLDSTQYSLHNKKFQSITISNGLIIIMFDMLISLLISIYSYNSYYLITWRSSINKNIIQINFELIVMFLICYLFSNTFIKNYLGVTISANSSQYHIYFIEYLFSNFLYKKSIVIE